MSYADNELGAGFKAAAQMIKADIGVQAISIDYGGWDTHEYQADGANGHFPNLLGGLAEGLAAFYKDLDASGATKRVTIVAMSEFGRRLAENDSTGTDHGHGGSMLVLGGNVNGGALYGAWPGLADEQLYERTDLEITTDYRHVLGEILVAPAWQHQHRARSFPATSAKPRWASCVSRARQVFGRPGTHIAPDGRRLSRILTSQHTHADQINIRAVLPDMFAQPAFAHKTTSLIRSNCAVVCRVHRQVYSSKVSQLESIFQ